MKWRTPPAPQLPHNFRVRSRPEFIEVRRQFERIHFDQPLPGKLSGQPVQILDLAIGGVRLLAPFRVTPASAHSLDLEWGGKKIQLQCLVTRCTLQTLGTAGTYEIGLRISQAMPDSDRIMHEMIGHFVMRALAEQAANWNGIPPAGPYVYVEGKGRHYRRCELVEGNWRVTTTTRPEQPLRGFTVSAEVSPRYLGMLCDTYENGDDEGRRLTRILAELSINKAEGVPTRRYQP